MRVQLCGYGHVQGTCVVRYIMKIQRIIKIDSFIEYPFTIIFDSTIRFIQIRYKWLHGESSWGVLL